MIGVKCKSYNKAMTKSIEEKKLIQSVIEGDEKAFEKLFYLYKDKLYTFCIKLTKSEDIAEEIVHDVFLKIWKNRSNINIDLSFNAYLFKITQNFALDFLEEITKETRAKKELLLSLDRSYNHIENYVLNEEYQALVEKAIDRLPPQKRIIFTLSRNDGLSYDEIAEKLNLSRNTVKNHIIEALKIIKKFIQFNSDITLFVLYLLVELYDF